MFLFASRHGRSLPIRRFNQLRAFHVSPSLFQEKLNVLFCGADRFSVAHLQALHEESTLPESSIGSVHVVTRTDKRHGRGSSAITAPPVKDAALQLGLNVHQLDTFTGWSPPPTDLIVAVSFGLLIPSRILQASKYGGINVHPSLLPDLRGAAPVHWAIMLGRKHTGVTIQSLHPTKFDHGVIIAQTPAPGIPINGRYGGLTDTLSAFGCDMLLDTIRKGLYKPPYQPIAPRKFDELAMAPKIASEHRQIDFDSLTAEDIIRRSNALGRLYTFAQDATGRKVRVVINENIGIYVPQDPQVRDICKWQPVGHPYAIQGADGHFLSPMSATNNALFINTIDGKTLHVTRMTVEGLGTMDAIMAARRKQLLGPLRQQHGFQTFRVSWFHAPLSATGPIGSATGAGASGDAPADT
ncbi:Methionyl-tRNA formyltransferase, mitochondrial [Cyphellophora attinorum]|uniref:methionyl-tRNA formyltransferase n=1 Tax=Cyphellophora attinorum TaxID=1664694 RepID=A0A0N0NJ45_9EURO|nr:Methionyl-tRNA formyltransferase, mitochondrial [Phialophora attinorum]KPI36561.1 Methionyl-tRNA formyltransferase, mitochondrial [Phialophora attinorum]